MPAYTKTYALKQRFCMKYFPHAEIYSVSVLVCKMKVRLKVGFHHMVKSLPGIVGIEVQSPAS